jgi:uncharacterized protein YjaG (DUF416 family)
MRYDESELIRKLENLSKLGRVVFGAACAERAFPAFAAYEEGGGSTDRVRLFRTTLDDIWDGVIQGTELVGLDKKIDNCLSSIPSEDEEPDTYPGLAAEDAASAICYTLQCWKTGDSQEAAWAARRTYEALDGYIIEHESIDINEPGAESRVEANDIIQSELRRQHRDIEELANLPERGLEVFRDRAVVEARTFFGNLT